MFIANSAMEAANFRTNDAQLGQRLKKSFNRVTAEDKFSGTAMLAKGDKPIFKKAYGLANIGYNVPNRLDTKFNLGSLNKMF